MNDILKIKDENITTILIRIHSPYDDAKYLSNNIDETSKNLIVSHMNHSMNIFLFDNIDSDFYKLI